MADYYKDRRSPGGYRTECKPCNAEYKREYVAQRADQVKAYQAAYRAAHREKARATTARYRAEKPDRVAAAQIAYRADPAHKEIARERARAFRIANPERRLEYDRRRRAKMRASAVGPRVITPEQLAAKKAYWGDRCWMCHGEANAWDHVKPINKQGAHILANLRPACLPCNTRKSDRWPLAEVLARVG
jgi:5-methylcytosine-specific restriction endonuclease McrA